MVRAADLRYTSSPSPSVHEAVVQRGSLALELINTQTLDRGKQHDALASPEALARWWAEVCTRSPDQCVIAGAEAPIVRTSELFAAVKALRMALRTLLQHVVEHQAVEVEDLQPVNVILKLAYTALERTGEGNIKAVMHVRDPEQGSILVPIARSAMQLFTEADWRRLHQCKHDRCIMFFYDTTKSGTRRWCSSACMNRARSIQHYQLTKKSAAREPE
ncbi:MAG TPA: ABATE domain-containing protein [Ktedonobacterales bacterium]|nr:ABATE domain-containing protein [Ktedonobacterales bacterium]